MSWVREDDAELLDPRVGALRALEYVELHALRQYVAREHAGAGGIFLEDELRGVGFVSDGRVRSVRRRSLERFEELGLVRRLSSYSPAELDELEHGERTNRRYAYQEAAADIREALAEGLEDALRLHRWEHYNAPRDRTAGERKARYRARSGGEGTRTGTGIGTPSVRARLPVPSRPVLTSTPTSEVDGEGPDDLDFGELSRPAASSSRPSELLEPASELLVVRLLAACGRLEPVQADRLRAYAERAPEAVLARILERLADGDVLERYGYALGALRKELGA